MKIIKLKYLLLLSIIALVGCSKSPATGMNYGEEGSEVAPDASPTVNDRLALEAGLKKVVYHVGPVDLPRGLKSEEMLDRPLTMTFQMDESVWVVGFSPRVVDSNGAELPSDLLHLAIASNLHEENPLCSDAGSGNPFAMATTTLSGIDLPAGYGYPLLATDPIEVRAVLKNESSESYVDVYFELTLLVKPMNEFANLRDVRPIYLEMDPCTHGTVEVAPGEFSKFDATFEIPEDSNLIVAHSALSNYGSGVELTARDESSPFWQANAELDEEHRIVSIEGDPFEDPAGIPFKEGDSITMEVAYDNSSDSWIDDATAATIIYMAPKN